MKEVQSIADIQQILRKALTRNFSYEAPDRRANPLNAEWIE
jgi:hypothetical protein